VIAAPTVLVLGAGAGKPFGFPTGRELLERIVVETIHPENGKLGKILLHCGFDVNEISNFGQTLSFSQKNSVDAFLEHRSAEYLKIGKAAIAGALSPDEDMETLRKGDWYRYLFNQLNSSFDDFDRNPLSIITFNYDRSIEQFLYSALRHSYGRGISESAAKLKAIPIVHLHGSLGGLAELESNGQRYGGAVTGGIVQERAKQIEIIHEISDKELRTRLPFKEAHRLLGEAKRVCFLGFGYDLTNLRRLLQPSDVLRGKWVVGSAFGLTSTEKEFIRKHVECDLQLRAAHEDCLATLRETGILF
jgi:hypothetical protein